MVTWIEEYIAASAFVFFSILSAHRLLSGAKRKFNEWTAGAENGIGKKGTSVTSRPLSYYRRFALPDKQFQRGDSANFGAERDRSRGPVSPEPDSGERPV